MLREIAVERYAFRCKHCLRTWTGDYDVQYVTDADGSLWAFYRRDGAPMENPAHDVLLCPECGRAAVTARMVARRDTPPAELTSDHPRHKVTTSAADRRAAVPPLPSGHPPGSGNAVEGDRPAVK